MNDNSMLNPPAIVREEKDASYWDSQNVEAASLGTLSSLKHGEALYNLNLDEKYKQLGYNSLGEYCFARLNRSNGWASKLVAIHEKMVVDLGISQKELLEVSFGKLCKVVAHINEDNKDEILSDVKNMSQREVDQYIKGFNPATEEYDEDKEETKTLSLKGPASMIEVVETSLALAKDTLCNMSEFYQTPDDVPPLKGFDFICAVFLAGADLDGCPVSTLEASLASLEAVYGIDISWEEKDAE